MNVPPAFCVARNQIIESEEEKKVVIEINDISRTFEQKKEKIEALSHVSLAIEKGDIYGIIGFSGAGKSTLVRMINALEKPDSGTVLVEGKDVNKLPKPELRKLRKQIGMIFQQFNLLDSKTVYDNIAIPMKLNHKSSAEIEKKVRASGICGADREKGCLPGKSFRRTETAGRHCKGACDGPVDPAL